MVEERFNPLDPLGIFEAVKRDVDRIACALRFDLVDALKLDSLPIPSQPAKFSSPINYPPISPYGTRIGEPERVTEIPKPETVPMPAPSKAPTNDERKKVPIPPEKVPLPEKVA